MCPICHQPECDGEGARPLPGTHATKLEPGQKAYRGYGDWAVHPDEARFVLHRGHAMVDGEPKRVYFSHNEAYVTQIHVQGTRVE